MGLFFVDWVAECRWTDWIAGLSLGAECGCFFMKTIIGNWLGVLMLCLAAGCVSDPSEEMGKEIKRVRSSEPPTFLSGDLAGIFAGATFAARLEVQRGLPGSQPAITGELSARNGSLYFMSDDQRLMRGMAGGLSVFYDAAAKTSYLLNDPLQAYAPVRNPDVGSSTEATVVGEEELNGERARKSVVNRRVGGELIPQYVVWRSTAQGDLPVRIQTTNMPSLTTFTLSRIRAQAPPAELFALPSGFKKYETTEAMMSELLTRRSSRLEGERRGRKQYWDNSGDGYDPLRERPNRPY